MKKTKPFYGWFALSGGVLVTLIAVSASVVGVVHDATGKYAIAFLAIAICVIGGMFCSFFAKPPKAAR
jgi:cyanate permease